ncbi:MAG: sigma-70 family RNA polymerase sigma factor [Streptosporangiales bacterium]|nr:sigma-70 family RNA polymerase sigma factor [Streptosporangiales bacterium]
MSTEQPDRRGDAELWAMVGRDDPSAFGELFERHADAVYNHCFRRTGSWSTAEDLTSAVFLDAWRRRHEVTLTTESVLPWLLAVANNDVRNQRRALWRRRRLIAKLPHAVVAPDPADEAAERIDDERAMQRVLKVFRKLTAGEQDVLALCVWAELSYADAAVALGVPVGTVRSRLARARQQLRRLTDSGELDAAGGGGAPGRVASGRVEGGTLR